MIESLEIHQMKVIARIHTEFQDKFGVPRQSGIASSTMAKIVFEPRFRSREALRGLEGFSHLWIIWCFSKAARDSWSPTVRPPRLGGNRRMGVFATRSPFRPNPIALSSVQIESIDLDTQEGPVIYVSGADMMDGTPIYDIKPYLAYTDSHPDALQGFISEVQEKETRLDVVISEETASLFTPKKLKALKEVLSLDPRPHYQNDPFRVYGMEFSGINVKFRVEENTVIVL